MVRGIKVLIDVSSTSIEKEEELCIFVLDYGRRRRRKKLEMARMQHPGPL
jgi:hypothetical protein